VSEDKQGKQLVSTTEWRWKQFDGIYLPTWRKEVVFRKGGKDAATVLECTLESCFVNRPLGSHQFDYQGLGLKEGDLVVDKIEKRMLIMEGGQPVKLADFGEKYVPPEARRSALPRVWAFAISIVLFALLIGILIARRYRRRIARDES